MIISTKCQYALRAVFEIVRSDDRRVMTIGEIARAQRVPQRYLEGILNQLRKGGLLQAQRGRSGGYRLARNASDITVGDVVRLIDGPIRAVVEARTTDRRPSESYVFLPTWHKVEEVIDQTLNSTSFSELREIDKEARLSGSPSYVI